MKPKKYTGEGIILARKNYKEADRIITVYSDKYGKLYLLAKGVRRPKSKKRGHLEIFSHIHFSSSSGKGVDFISEVETVDSYLGIRRNLAKVSVAYFFVEVVNGLVREEEKNIQLFNLICQYLEKLESSTNLKKLRGDFVRDILVMLGFWPQERPMNDYDEILKQVLEREVKTVRIGKKILTN